MRKAERHKIIKQIIVANEIETQEELLNRLRDEGIQLTQATISRDIRELNIVKAYTKEGKKKFTLIATEHNDHALQKKLEKGIIHYATLIERVHFLVIIHTMPNGADVIANYMDEIEFDEVVATMAGYDTLIIVTRSEEMAIQFHLKLSEFLKKAQ